MAQNLFEKYGIKEVADVTLYRIEKKDETYESHRKISASSILKGALSKQMVYPLDESGKGSDEGYEALVFKNAEVLNHFNYDCDDVIDVRGSAILIDTEGLVQGEYTKGTALNTEDTTAVKNFLLDDTDSDNIINLFDSNNVVITSLVDTKSNENIRNRYINWLINGYQVSEATFTDREGSPALSYLGNVSTSIEETSEQDLVQYISHLIVTDNMPIGPQGVTVQELLNYAEDNPYLTFSTTGSGQDAKLTGGQLVIPAPYNAAPEEVQAAFRLYQKDIYDDLGIVTRWTQPLRTSASAGGLVNGTLKVEFTYKENDDTHSARMTVELKNATLTTEQLATWERVKNSTAETVNKTDLSIIGSLTGTGVTVSFVTLPTELELEITAAIFSEATTTITSVDAETISYKKILVKFSSVIVNSEELDTGIYDFDETSGHYHMDADRENEGTHEFSYAEQVCMLFAKNQNLITKAGTRYQFENYSELFGNFEFNDDFAAAPNSKERVVVVGLPGQLSEALYDENEVNEAIKELDTTLEAKAYEVTYSDYAELAVEDEMGYYMYEQLGYAYDKKTGTITTFSATQTTYSDWADKRRGIDSGIANAVMTWGNDKHYSINDAIDALKQESKLLDTSGDFTETGYNRVFGGYRVIGTGLDAREVRPFDDSRSQYEDVTLNGAKVRNAAGEEIHPGYSLEKVLQALSVAQLYGDTGELRFSSTAEMESNRAIYINPETGLIGNGAHIYLLKNTKVNALSSDKNGIFEFRDKKGNKLYYQDLIFKGTAYLALVAIGQLGLIFLVDRHCSKTFSQTAWMINDNGYITDKQAAKLVENGLIHTVTVTACNESFDATCTVKSIKTRRTKKNVLRYIPVLFLDTLKVSTLEQASEKSDATGGRGNAKLMTWDYGKEITLSIEDALFTPASMSAIWGGQNGDLKNGVKDASLIDRMEKITAKRNFIIPAGNQNGTPTEGDISAQAVYYDPKTMEPFQDGTPIAEGETLYKFTRSVAYDNNSIGNTIEISAEKFPGTYRVVGETCVRDKQTGEDQRFQFIIPEAKMSAEDTSITLEADGDPVVFSFSMDVLRPNDGIMMKFVQFDVVENTEENDGSTMIKNTENLNLLDDAEMYKVNNLEDEEFMVGATEY